MQPRRPTHEQQLAADMAALDRLPLPVKCPPAPTCRTCQQFAPDAINPPAGLGDCLAGHGSHYPDQPHHCTHHQRTEVTP